MGAEVVGSAEVTLAEAGTRSGEWRHLLAFVTLALLVLLAFLLVLMLGSVRIPLREVATILLGGEAERATWSTIVWQVRLPRAISATLAGAALAVAGLQMQTLFRNPLAGPFVLGISSGASLGVAFVLLGVGGAGATLLAGLGLLGDLGIALAATLGAAVTMTLVLVVAERAPGTATILLLGLMFGYIASALVSVLLHLAVAERVQAYVIWTFGSFGAVTWSQLRVLAPAVLIALGVATLSVKPLNALLLGEAYAATLGMDVASARRSIIASASVLAGVVTAFCGPVAFLGTAVPHLCRGLFATANHRILVPAAALMGAILALLADLLTHLPATGTLPLNAVTALIGAPVVIWVILRNRGATLQ